MKSKSGYLSIFLLLSALISLSGIFSDCAYITGEAIAIPAPPPPVIKDITPEEANSMTMFSSFYTQFIDVRTPQEYAGGHIGNAINIDFNSADFKEKINKLDKKARYIVYCRTGVRSAAASEVMAKLGFMDIYNMAGGVSAWEAAGLPIAK